MILPLSLSSCRRRKVLCRYDSDYAATSILGKRTKGGVGVFEKYILIELATNPPRHLRPQTLTLFGKVKRLDLAVAQ